MASGLNPTQRHSDRPRRRLPAHWCSPKLRVLRRADRCGKLPPLPLLPAFAPATCLTSTVSRFTSWKRRLRVPRDGLASCSFMAIRRSHTAGASSCCRWPAAGFSRARVDMRAMRTTGWDDGRRRCISVARQSGAGCHRAGLRLRCHRTAAVVGTRPGSSRGCYCAVIHQTCSALLR